MQNPQSKIDVETALSLCGDLMEGEQVMEGQNNQLPIGGIGSVEETIQNKNMLSTMKLLPRLESLIFPSQCSFYHFN